MLTRQSFVYCCMQKDLFHGNEGNRSQITCGSFGKALVTFSLISSVFNGGSPQMVMYFILADIDACAYVCAREREREISKKYSQLYKEEVGINKFHRHINQPLFPKFGTKISFNQDS